MKQQANRMAAIPPYFFAELGQRIAELKRAGHEVIRMDMGSPDLPPPPHIIESLVNSARSGGHHGYSPYGGTDGYCQAVVAHYQRRFGVSLDPATEVLGLIGSKEGLFHITQAMVDPGDVVLVPDPGYPVYSTAARFAGGRVVYLPLSPEDGFLPQIESLSPGDRRQAKLLWINYPNNPTGATAGLDFFRDMVAFSRENGILLCHDAPYTDVCFDGYQAPSLLQVEGAKEVAVEFNSLSKSHNMAGWRAGMAVGQPEALRALYKLKSQVDTSQFRGILDAAETALKEDQSWLEQRNAIYQERRDLILAGVRAAGMAAAVPKATLYVWARLPGGVESSKEFCSRMLDEIHVSTTPGVAFGQHGEGYLRLSLGTPTASVEQAMGRLAEWRFSS
jgi:LL-diaminopimelate aminotransferase